MREISLLVTALSCFIVSDLKEITPKEIDDLLANPGMGWQTFHRLLMKTRLCRDCLAHRHIFVFIGAKLNR
ncbi:MAG: hypothetical protein ACPL7B_02820 [Candidatus Poribacteria bacterium]